MSAVAPPPTELEAAAPPRSSRILGPFESRDFRLLWSGMIVSNLGTWMQITAVGYLVVSLAPTPALSSFYVGLLGAATAIPALVISPLAGVIADRAPRRRVLLLTSTTTSLIALALALLAMFHLINLYNLLLLAALRTVAASIEAPARHSWIPLLVPREYLGNAIGLNSIAFNAPSVIGPPIAGALILSIGVAASFYVNAIATLATVLAVFLMQPAAASTSVRESMADAMLAGARFLLSDPVLRPVMVLLFITCVLVRPYASLMPAYAAHVVHVDARGLGFLLGAGGVGAIAGALVTSIVGTRRRGVVWFVSAVVMSLGAILLGATPAFPVAAAALVVMGMAVLSFAGSSMVLVQTLSPESLRGRSVAVFAMIIIGIVPAGSLVLGSIASLVSLPTAIVGGGVIALGFTLWTFLTNAELRQV